jgi:translation initiation factor 3 subunit C
MSKWFQRPSDSESEESESSEDEKQQVPQQTAAAATKKAAAPQGRKQYMKGFDDSSESEEDTRVVKTTKDKKAEVINNIIKDLKNRLKINDYGQIMEDFDKLTEEIERSGSLVFESGNDDILPLYIKRIFAHIENSINDLTAE